jgi:hypothetical protein
MTERREHEEFDRLLGSGSGFGDDELAKLAGLARALERNRPQIAGPAPAFRAALRNKLLEEARTDVVIPLSLAARVRATVAARNARARRSFRAIVATAAAAAMLLVSGAAFAATASSIPGDTGYAVKRFREKLQLAVTFGNAGKAYKELDFARERLEEVRALKDAGVERTALYTSTFADMDQSTKDATARLIREFRSTGDESVLQPLVDFSRGQRDSLESIFDQLPPGARPSARSSLELVVAVQDRVSDVLGGCPCPEDVLVPAGSTTAPPCTCSTDRTDANGLPRRSDQSDGGTTVQPSPPPGPDDHVVPPPPTNSPLPEVEGTDVDNTVGDLLGDVIDGTPTPSPLPSLSLNLP